MTNIKNLIKIYIKQMISNYLSLGSKKKASSGSKKIAGIMIFVLIFAYLMFAVGLLYIIQLEQLQAAGMQDYIILISFILSSLIIFLIVTYEISGHFFRTKDFEIVASMPITSLQIVVSKFFSTLIFAYLYQSVVFLPAFAIGISYGLFTVTGIIFLVLGFLFLPFFSLLICSFLAYLLNFITSKIKQYTYLNLIISFALLLGLTVAIYFVNMGLTSIFINSGNIPLFVYFFVPTSILFFNAIVTGSIIWFLLFIVASIISFVLTMLLLSFFFKKINQNLNNNKKTASKKGKIKYRQRGVLGSLFHLEIKNYFNSSIYVLNTMFGMVLLLIASIVALVMYFSNPQLISMFSKEFIFVLLILFFCFSCGLSLTTNSSISMEGRNLYIKKSLPLKYSQVFISKILVNLVIVLPFLILSYLMILPILIDVQVSIFAMISILVVPLVLVSVLSTMSLMINLWFPKLQFTTETEVVKQSLSVLITSFLGMALVGLFVVVYMFLVPFLDLYLYVAICTLFMILIGFLFVYLLRTKGQAIFKEL